MNKGVVIVAGLIGLICLIVGIIYLTQPAGSLPSFFPGYETGAKGAHDHHAKHGILAIVVAIACFIFAWFRSGSKPSASSG